MHDVSLRKPGRLIRFLQKKSFFNKRNIFWSWYEPYNFGDWVGPYLYQAMTGKTPLYCQPGIKPPCTYFISAGSVLRKIKYDDAAIVWGSGIISRDDVFARPLKIHAVRGPHSMEQCHRLGYDCPAVFGDPAILLPNFYTPKSLVRYRMGIIPHFIDRDIAVGMLKSDHDILIIDVTKPIEDVIEQIASCETTVSSSLHGLIVSHVYGRPSAWVKFSESLEGDGVKFADYMAASGITDPLTPVDIKASMSLKDFITIARDAPRPENKALVPALIKACPIPT